MKKITFLLFTICAFNFQAKAQYCDSMPSSNDGIGITDLVVGDTSFTSGGDITYEDFTGTVVDLQAGVSANVQITFATGYTYGTNIWIDFGDDDSFAEAGDLVYSGTSTSANPTTLNASFTMPAGAVIGAHRMRIGTADSGQATPNPCYNGSYGVTMDVDINVTAAPSCLPPISLAASSITTTSASISWAAGGSETQWEVVTLLSPSTEPGSGAAVTSTGVGVGSLTPNTAYDTWVRSDCGSEFSVWTMITFSTLPEPPTNDTPTTAIALTLDEGSMCGANTITGISNFGSSDSGVAAPACGSYGTPTTPADIWYTFVAPANGVLTLNTTNISGLSSVAGAYYSGMPGALVEGGCTQFGSGWPWDLTGLTGGETYYLRVWDYGNNDTGTFDLCGYFQTCVAPTGLTAMATGETTADLAWTAGGTETAWEYVVQLDGTGEPTGAGTPSATPSASITGLTTDTAYETYVRADCGGGDFSDWFGPVDFVTLPAPAAVPYINDFSVFPGTNWIEAGSGDATTGPMGIGAGSWHSQNYANDGATNGLAASVNLYTTTQIGEWLISPPLDLMAAGPYYLNMDVAVTTFAGTAVSAMGSDDEVQILITSDSGSTWTSLFTWDATNAPGNAREAAGEIDLSAYAGNNVQIAIWATEGAVNDPEDYDFFIDNFQVTTVSLSTEDVAFEGFKYFPNPVEGTLSLRAQDNIQAVSVYNMLGQEVMRSAPNAFSSELDMSNLQTGAYFVKVKINDVEDNFRIIKD